jgi:hypothetical protein
MVEIKETTDQVAGLLRDFAKAKNFNPAEITAVRSKIRGEILAASSTPETATTNYKLVCLEFLEKVTKVRGLPGRTVSSSDDVNSGEGRSGLVSVSSPHVAQQFDKLLPKIKERLPWCIENYRSRAVEYFNDQVSALFVLIDDFLHNPPSTLKAGSPKISEIKKEIRYLVKWDQVFYTWHSSLFPGEVEHIFIIGHDQSDGPIGAIWHYSRLDEQSDYQKTYDHKPRDKAVYLVDGSWAAQKGLIAFSPERRLSSIDPPHRAVDCMCSLQWVYSLRDLPPELLTDAGRSELERAKKAVARIMAGEPLRDLANPPKPKRWFQRLFGG